MKCYHSQQNIQKQKQNYTIYHCLTFHIVCLPSNAVGNANINFLQLIIYYVMVLLSNQERSQLCFILIRSLRAIKTVWRNSYKI